MENYIESLVRRYLAEGKRIELIEDKARCTDGEDEPTLTVNGRRLHGFFSWETAKIVCGQLEESIDGLKIHMSQKALDHI